MTSGFFHLPTKEVGEHLHFNEGIAKLAKEQNLSELIL